MGNLSIFTARLASLLVLHAAGAGLASPTVLVSRPPARVQVDWLPTDNQTVYKLREGETRSLELNITSIPETPVFINISPCSRDFHWALYHGKTHSQGSLTLLKEHNGVEMKTFSIFIAPQDRYILQLSTIRGGACAVSVRGESTRLVRLRLRTRSRRRLVANWDPSPIDPQATTYCVVASHLKNYTSLCAAQCDSKANRLENKSFEQYDRDSIENREDSRQIDCASAQIDNKVEVDPFGIFEGNFKSVYRRKKFGRSTKVSDEDPVIACVGDRTHHLFENLDPSKMYYVSVFGLATDRQAGSLLATSSVRPRTSTAKRLRENQPYRADIRSKVVYYFKATVGMGGGLWLTVTTCGGAVDIEVTVRGKRLYMAKNIDSHSKFFVPTPIPNSSIQETSDEGSVQFDSSSEEARMRYVIKVAPSRWDRDGTVNVEIAASTSRWGVNTPELSEDGAIVRELRPKRSCRSIDIAFLPATHNATDVIRYCIMVRESPNGDFNACSFTRKYAARNQCFNNIQRPPTRVIVQKIGGLKPGRKYALQVTASTKGSSVPYKMLYVDTNISCKDDV
ncbi:protein NDNF-like [Ostrinia nubilalis]|uniref:protein NDNF-like n=1 Tax=Ostrinia nubilalis TaxID=29057 RepID=UPI003082344C